MLSTLLSIVLLKKAQAKINSLFYLIISNHRVTKSKNALETRSFCMVFLFVVQVSFGCRQQTCKSAEWEALHLYTMCLCIQVNVVNCPRCSSLIHARMEAL